MRSGGREEGGGGDSCCAAVFPEISWKAADQGLGSEIKQVH